MIHNNDKISSLIEDADDPKDRAFLIVLQQINQSLIANTSTINDVASQLNAHLVNYETHAKKSEALVNRGKGAWLIASWVIGILQLAIIAVGTALYNNINTLHDIDSKLESRIIKLESK